MKKLITMSICLLVSFFAVQAQFPRDSVYAYNGDLHFYIEEEKFILQFEGSLYSHGNTFNFYKDTLEIERSIPSFGVRAYHYDAPENTLHIISRSYPDAKLISINFASNTIQSQTFENYSGKFIYNGKAYFTVIGTDEIVSHDIKDGVNKRYSIKELFNKGTSDRPLFIVKLDDDNMVVCTGYYAGDELRDVEYYMFNETNHIATSIEPTGNLAKVFPSEDDYAWFEFYNLEQSFAFCSNGILDSDYRFFSGFVNQFDLIVNDFVIKNGEIIQLFVISYLDETVSRWSQHRQRVCIPYVPNPHLERVMYMVYSDDLLSRADLARFDAHDLRLMRNMVFAKHNYDFTDSYLKAYFNLYQFYRSGHSRRIKDVNDQLTEADKANIALIRAAEARVKE